MAVGQPEWYSASSTLSSLSRVYVSWRLGWRVGFSQIQTKQYKCKGACSLCFIPNTSGRVCERGARIFINPIKIETQVRVRVCVCARAKAAHFHTGNVALLATCSLWRRKKTVAENFLSYFFSSLLSGANLAETTNMLLTMLLLLLCVTDQYFAKYADLIKLTQEQRLLRRQET